MQDGAGGEERLSIGRLAERTGVREGTLRMWEQRHAFPAPERMEGGHRRYSEADVELVRQVVREREGGVSMSAAVERVVSARNRPADSIFAGVRRRTPGLEPRLIDKRSLMEMVHAIEDECLAHADHPLLVGSFQQERFYRQAESRWRALSANAALSVVFADFAKVREPSGGPIELPIDRSDPLAREWTVVCRGTEFAVALSAWERPPVREEEARRFEVLWSVDPEFVDEAAWIGAGLARKSSPAVAERLVEALGRDPAREGGVDRLVSLANRMLAYVAGSRRDSGG